MQNPAEISLKRALCLLLTLALLSACIPLKEMFPTPTQPAPDPALQLFSAGLDSPDAAERKANFRRLQQRFPNSPWNQRAKRIESLAASIDDLQDRIKRQQEIIKAQKTDRLELNDLRQRNDLLREQVEVLKSMIVDLQLKQP